MIHEIKEEFYKNKFEADTLRNENQKLILICDAKEKTIQEMAKELEELRATKQKQTNFKSQVRDMINATCNLHKFLLKQIILSSKDKDHIEDIKNKLELLREEIYID